MANSFTFNSVDMFDYDLIVEHHNIPDVSKHIPYIQLQDTAYSGTAQREPKTLRLDCTILGTDVDDVKSKLDSVIGIIDSGIKQLIVDGTCRYYNAEFQNRTGDKLGINNWRGTLVFLCTNPLAYSTTETSSDFNIDADPKTISETVGGTAITLPVWTLTAGETLTDVTIKLENVTTGEELQWTGSLADADTLEIDCQYWTVKKNGTSDMNITGEFPRLNTGSNTIKVTGLSTTGTLNITYRDAYI